MGDDRTELARLYAGMVRIRAVEAAFTALWEEGRVGGELHTCVGEEAAVVGVADHLRPGDRVAVDHRSTGPFVAAGTDIEALVAEVLGDPAGLCGGQGGHMHLFDPDRGLAASGIVGASGPLACGFGLAAQRADDGSMAVAYFGEGAVNQGMLMEALNLAVAWRLPVVFVCKDDGWAITTRSRSMTGGGIRARARGFGLPVTTVDGSDVERVWSAASSMVGRARAGRGPSLLHVRVRHADGHFLGFQLRDLVTDPVNEMPAVLVPMARSARRRDTAVPDRLAGLMAVSRATVEAAVSWALPHRDPVSRARGRLSEGAAEEVEARVFAEVADAVRAAASTGSAAEEGP